MQVDRGDVIELHGPHLADAQRRRPRAGRVEIVDLEHGHVRAVAAAVEEAARGRAVLDRRHDLDEGVPQRHHRVAQAEVSDTRIGVRLAQRQRGTQLVDGRVEVARGQHRLAQTKHRPTSHSDPSPRRATHGRWKWRCA
jgi:hypothetical protein